MGTLNDKIKVTTFLILGFIKLSCKRRHLWTQWTWQIKLSQVPGYKPTRESDFRHYLMLPSHDAHHLQSWKSLVIKSGNGQYNPRKTMPRRKLDFLKHILLSYDCLKQLNKVLWLKNWFYNPEKKDISVLQTT